MLRECTAGCRLTLTITVPTGAPPAVDRHCNRLSCSSLNLPAGCQLTTVARIRRSCCCSLALGEPGSCRPAGYHSLPVAAELHHAASLSVPVYLLTAVMIMCCIALRAYNCSRFLVVGKATAECVTCTSILHILHVKYVC